MIFDNVAVTKLVTRWQRTNDPAVLDRIVEMSNSLVEAIVSSYPKEDRDDLIQEAMLKLSNACNYFDTGSSSTLHNYFTTVIHNACITFISKPKELLLDDNNIEADEEETYESREIIAYPEEPLEALEDLLPQLVIHLRKRFPSIPAAILDECAEIIYCSLKAEEPSKIIISSIVSNTMIAKSVATIIYQSSMIFLRCVTISNSKKVEYNNEFTLIHDLRFVLGEEEYQKIMIVFAGMYLKLPK